MTKPVHQIYIATMVLICIIVTIYLATTGYEYYQLPLEERFYHQHHDWFKPSGIMGHSLGIIGTFLILFGVVIYILRKRYNFLSRWIRLKYLLEFHIFLCVLGPIMIVFHTAFKVGGLVSIAFWSMLAVVLSGVIGRFIYIQIPRTIEGRELSLSELQQMRSKLSAEIINSVSPSLSTTLSQMFDASNILDHQELKSRRKKLVYLLNEEGMSRSGRKKILKLMSAEIKLSGRIQRLDKMKKFFQYWHVAHLPFALIMLIIVTIHVVVTLAFGYSWIF